MVEMRFVGLEIDKNTWRNFSNKVERRYHAKHRNSMVVRILLNAYYYDLIDLDDLMEKLEARPEDIFIGGYGVHK